MDTREIALVKKDLLYIGKPCKKGHIGERYTSTGQCVICIKQYRIQYRKENKQRVAENRNRYSKEKIFGTEEYKSYRREHYKKNRSTILARNKTPSYRIRKTASQMKRYTQQMNAMPLWADKDLIEFQYVKARFMEWFTDEKYHVDHIIPLQGKDVCGLHVEYNLQVIPATENLKKSNKLEI